MKENIQGSIQKLYVVHKPYSGCDCENKPLIKQIDPLLGIGAGHTIIPEKVHSIYSDENSANKIANELCNSHIESEIKLEEKKVKVEKKLKGAISELEKVREGNMRMLKEDPTNSEAKEQIANLTEKINTYLEILEKINKSKKPQNKKENKEENKKEKVEEAFLSKISAGAKGAFAGAKDFGKSIGSAFKGASDVAKSTTVNEKIKNLDKEFTSFISDIDKMIEKDQIPKNLKINLKKYRTELEEFEKTNKKYIVEPEKKEEPKKNTDKKEGSKENNKKEKEERKKRREELEKTLNNPDTPEYLKKKIEAVLNPKKEEEPETKPAKPAETEKAKTKPAETEKTRKELKPPENIKSKSKIPQGDRNKKTPDIKNSNKTNKNSDDKNPPEVNIPKIYTKSTEKTRKELKPPENIKSKSKIPQGDRNKKTQIKESIIKFLIQNK
jgi:hypothetical protein